LITTLDKISKATRGRAKEKRRRAVERTIDIFPCGKETTYPKASSKGGPWWSLPVWSRALVLYILLNIIRFV